MTNPLRRLPAAVLLIVLALLPLQAWFAIGSGKLVLKNGIDGLDAITWTGVVAPDGRLSVRIEYDLGNDELSTLDIRVPSGTRYLAVNGEPVQADIGLYASVEVQRTAVITYEVLGRVTRYEDGALLRMAQLNPGSSGYLDGDEALFPCVRCYLDTTDYGHAPLYGALYAPGAEDAVLRLSRIDPIHAETDPGVTRFVAIDEGADSVSLLATLPSAAVEELPVTPGTVDDAVEAVIDEVSGTDEPFHEPAGDRTRRTIFAVVLTLMFLGLLGWIATRFAAARRERAKSGESGRVDGDGDGDGDGDDDHDVTADVVERLAPFSPPSSLEPALAGLVVGGEGRGNRSVVAGTLLELARRDVISIDGVDSERFVLKVPPGARGETPFEEAVLAALRPQGQLTASATLTGPPLWGPEGDGVARRLARVLIREGVKAGLIRRTLSVLVLVPASLAMGIVALVGSEGLSGLALFAVIAGPILAVVAAILTGMSLTSKGRAERDRWEAYADWLRSNSQLRRVGAPGVATWGDVLPHAAALGAAPVAAKALSPRQGA